MKTTTGILVFLVIMVCSALTSPGQTPGDLKWKFTTGGSVWSSPAIAADGTIYIGSDDGRLYAIHPNGTEKWHFTASGVFPPAIRSSPAVAIDGTVYVADTAGILYAIRPSDGSQKWSVNIGAAIFSSPAVAIDGTIYIAAEDGFLYAVGSTARGGFIKWSFFAGVEQGSLLTSSPAVG
ncbi:MAG TPA: PQQ-binding-like beta-propeller repeat protein, partial [Methylomirabilota bacterium]|nr:PQQ-binding-like beta-propeller repeat protein [Methylomirabilota bacterium]